MRIKVLEEKITIPEGVTVSLDNNTVIVKGSKGENKRFNDTPVHITVDKDITLKCEHLSFREKALFYTLKANLLNMLKGVNEGFILKMKICSGHFPMSVTMDKNKITVKNFLGEKVSRYANIVGSSKVKMEGDTITVTGNNKEEVGQTVANIETSTKISNKDRRIFQDGIYRLK